MERTQVDVYAFVVDADSRARLGARRCCQPPLHRHGTMDVRALANASDLLYVMGYNDPARAAGRCVAGGDRSGSSPQSRISLNAVP